MANNVWGAVRGFDPSVAEGIQRGLSDRLTGLSGLEATVGSAQGLPGWDGPAKEAAAGSFADPLRYLTDAKGATSLAHANVGSFADEMSVLKTKAAAADAKAASAGFSIGDDGSIRDSYALSGLVDSLSPADRAHYEQVKAELPGDVSAVVSAAGAASTQAAHGLALASQLKGVSMLGASTLAAAAGDSDLTLYAEGPDQPDGINHDQNYQQVVDLIDGAHTSIDMTMYELMDQNIEDALVHAAQNGVNVRVVLDKDGEQKNNQAAYDYLTQNGVQVAWAVPMSDQNPKYSVTHQKTVTVDGDESAILTGNLTSRYYKTSRDFMVLDKDKNDVNAIEDTFNHDFAGQGSLSDGYKPPAGDHLIWSPTTAKSNILAVIDGAQHSLNIENEEMASPTIVQHLVQAAQRGVDVNVTLQDNYKYDKSFDQLAAAGVHVNLYDQKAPLYIHAKDIVADGSNAYVGSINFSDNSLTNNRELGIVTDDPGVIAGLAAADQSDFAGGTPYSGSG